MWNWTGRRVLARGFLSCVVALGAASASADPITFDFGGAEASLGSVLQLSHGGAVVVTVSGFYFDDPLQEWQPADLARRAGGVGVCAPSDLQSGSCGSAAELDDLGDPELMLLELAPGYEWASLGFSSFDEADGVRLFFDSDGIFGSPEATATFPGVSGGIHDFDEFPVQTPFIFIQTFEPGGGAPIAPPGFGAIASLGSTTADPNDLFLRGMVIEPLGAVPEPSSFLALGAGLAVLGLRGRRRRQRP